jgi:agmatinase
MQDLGAEGALADAGDLRISPGGAAREEIEAGIKKVLLDGYRPIALGGDHAITYPALRAINAFYQRPAILHIDAHPDLYDELDGDRFSHACPFARIMEEGLSSRIVQVGIRAMTGHQREQAARFSVEVIDMRAWESGARPDIWDGPVYFSIDIDALDPAYAPGVSHREPGGLSTRDVIGLIRSCGGTLIGADVVEFNPLQDATDITARVAAKLVKEVAGRMLHDTSA